MPANGKAYQLQTLQSAFIGWDDASAQPNSPSARILFVIVKRDASKVFKPPIDIKGLLVNVESSGGDVIYSLDGGDSVALAHRDRQGTTLGVIGSSGRKHSGPWNMFSYVNNYLLITLEE